jgi:hypothetical protein
LGAIFQLNLGIAIILLHNQDDLKPKLLALVPLRLILIFLNRLTATNVERTFFHAAFYLIFCRMHFSGGAINNSNKLA